MKASLTSPEEYISSLAEPRRSEIAELDRAIQDAAPQLKREMGYGIGYGPFHYKYASGREGDTYQIILASQKNYISLYVLCVHEGQYLAESYKDKLPKASIGKSCVRFKRLGDVDKEVIKELCRQAAALPPTGA